MNDEQRNELSNDTAYIQFEQYPDVTITEGQYRKFAKIITARPDLVQDLLEWKKNIAATLALADEFAQIPGPKFRAEYKHVFKDQIVNLRPSHLNSLAVSNFIHRYIQEIDNK